jgi:hypothetical protein
MNKYNRRHGQSNTSKGIYWILFAGIIAVLVYKIVEFKRKIKEVQDSEKQEQYKDYKEYKIRDTTYILIDSNTLLQRQ